MILSLIRTFRARRQVQRSIGQLLQRADDHFLDDIGLTRDEVAALLRDPPQAAGYGRLFGLPGVAVHLGR